MASYENDSGRRPSFSVDLESSRHQQHNPTPPQAAINGNRRHGQHAQTHLRLASFSSASPSFAPHSPEISAGSGSFRSAARQFFYGSNGTADVPSQSLSTPPTLPSSYVRDYTAEIASMALNDAGSNDDHAVLIPLPPPVDIPPLNSRASESTLTNLIRTQSLISNPLEPVKSSEGARSSIAGSETSDSGSSGIVMPSHTSLTAGVHRTVNQYLHEDDDEFDALDSHPLLPSPSGHDTNRRIQYGSEFAIEEEARRPSLFNRQSSDWLLPFKRRRPASVDSLAISDEEETQYFRNQTFSNLKPVIPQLKVLIKDWRSNATVPIHYLPSVVLGVLLNVLDGLSYGMILFPLSEPIFANLGPDGLSMFYVSCIISQLVYSLGGSAFKGGVGSEMIEVVPFFHSMAYTLLARIGDDKPDAVIATTILAYAISSIVTGCVFFALGAARIGSLIGFFPRHILVGCIGGVGWFLVATGLEVSSRMDGSLAYNLETLSFLFEPLVFCQWIIPLLLAIILIGLEHYVKHPLLVPGYFIIVFAAFHILVFVIGGINLSMLQELGWVFDSPVAQAPWYNFYSLYKFSAVDWKALASTIPAMFALTFFGILHVPINVPALAVSVGEDNVDVDRELIAHGISNALSGFAGSIQNYLVYTNSLLFIRSGADSRVAGVMLAIATSCIMFAGPGVIGIIPVMVVGALIFLLGIELMREALYDTWGRVNKFEYFVIVSIVVSMGVYDFVFGIIVGIILACGSFAVESSRKSAIKAIYSGQIARSTVRRHPFQQRFLKEVGDEIFVVKLFGYLFFGTIVSVENKIRELLTSTRTEAYSRIKYLVIDFNAVTGVDFSAAEGFTRMKRLLNSRDIVLAMCGVPDDVANGLQNVGLWEHTDDHSTHVFEDLNSALEWCENELLAVYYQVRDRQNQHLLQLHRQRQNHADRVSADANDDVNNNNLQQQQQQQQPESSLVAVPGVRDAASLISAHIAAQFSDMATPRKSFLQQASSAALLTDPTFKLSIIPEDSNEESSNAGLVSPKAIIAHEDEGDHHHHHHHHHHHQVTTSPQPITLLLQIFHELSPYPAEFWQVLTPLFKREQHAAGQSLYEFGDSAQGFYIVESGILKAEYKLEQGQFTEAIVAGTTAGELPFFSDTSRTANVIVERDAVVWKLDRSAWEFFLHDDQVTEEVLNERLKVALEMYRVALKLTVERFSAITAYVLTSS
ncbi:sulfate transporter family-domain-containing protein [Lipomyces japonicus]|uniref:sulfate transporter family-domain-containing protein n=1 Tax=Lipomyces japonicus TaxID=56871 RepID=UPI0034D01BDC